MIKKNIGNIEEDNNNLNINYIKIKKLKENILYLNIKDINWIKWKFNSFRYDSFITLYISNFERYLKDKLNNGDILINYSNKTSLELLHDTESYKRFTF